jgi:NAD(P)H-flavin reductase/ferredoxin
MSHVTLNTSSYETLDGESVLDCLLRHEQAIPHACKTGVCQSCLVKVVKGTLSPKAVAGLKPTLQAAGYALACQWVPSQEDVELLLTDAQTDAAPVVIRELQRLNPTVMRVALEFAGNDQRFSSRPGQYLNLINPSGVVRSYSIASDYEQDGCLELHVADTAQGQFTRWLFDEARPGMQLHARGPAGDCFYLPESNKDFPMLLVGTSTGLAPLYGIVRDALRQGHRGPITLLHGGSSTGRLYYINELQALNVKYPGFTYQPLVLNNDGKDPRICQGDITQVTLQQLNPATLAHQRVYLCGAPEFVQSLRKQVFMKGVRSSHIHCDAFVTRKVEAAA